MVGLVECCTGRIVQMRSGDCVGWEEEGKGGREGGREEKGRECV